MQRAPARPAQDLGEPHRARGRCGMGPGSRPRPDLRLPRHLRHWLLRDSEAEAVAVFGGGGVDQLWFVDRWRRAAMGVVLLIASIVFILSLRLWAPPDREPK